MTSHCLESGENFGIVLIKSGFEVGGSAVPYEVGTEASIVEHERLPDGRFLLVTSGRRRFKISRLDYSQPQLSGRITWLLEQEDTVREEVRAEAWRLVSDYTRLLETRYPGLKFEANSEDPLKLSYQIGEIIQVPPEKKQELLETLSAEERLQKEIRILRTFLNAER